MQFQTLWVTFEQRVGGREGVCIKGKLHDNSRQREQTIMHRPSRHVPEITTRLVWLDCHEQGQCYRCELQEMLWKNLFLNNSFPAIRLRPCYDCLKPGFLNWQERSESHHSPILNLCVSLNLSLEVRLSSTSQCCYIFGKGGMDARTPTQFPP